VNCIRSIVISTPVKTRVSILACVNEPPTREKPLRTERRVDKPQDRFRRDPMFENPQKTQVKRVT
jgi:hypothetical protein